MTASFPATSSWNRTFTSSTLQLGPQGPPAEGLGKRRGVAGRPADGDVYGNYNVLFHYPDGVDVTSAPRSFPRAGGK